MTCLDRQNKKDFKDSHARALYHSQLRCSKTIGSKTLNPLSVSAWQRRTCSTSNFAIWQLWGEQRVTPWGRYSAELNIKMFIFHLGIICNSNIGRATLPRESVAVAPWPAASALNAGLHFLCLWESYIQKTDLYTVRHRQFNEPPQTSGDLSSFVFMNSVQPKVKGGEYLRTCQIVLSYSGDSCTPSHTE